MPPIPEKHTPAYKAVKLAVIILSVLIILALIALVVGFVSGAGGKRAAASTSTFQLPPGARIVDMRDQPGRLILRVHDETGEEIDILDTQDGRLVGQVKATVRDKAR